MRGLPSGSAYNRFRLVTPTDWIWGVMVLGPAAALAAVLATGPHPAPAIGVAAVTAAAFWGITAWRYVLRYRWQRNLIGTTYTGVAVFRGPGVTQNVSVEEVHDLSTASLAFWSNHLDEALGIHFPECLEKFRDLAAGARGSALFLMVDDPSWHGQTPATYGMSVSGPELTSGRDVFVGCPPGRSKEEVLSLIWHGFGHAALYSLGVVGADEQQAHHAMFDRLGYLAAQPKPLAGLASKEQG